MENKYKYITDLQEKTLLDSKLRRFVGADSNQIGKLANQATQIMNENTRMRNERDNADLMPEEDDTSERDDLIESGEKLIDDIEDKFASYNATKIYYNKMKQLRHKLNVEKKMLTNSEQEIVATIHTNNRRVDYQEPELNQLLFIRTVLMIVLFIVVLVFIVRIKIINKIYQKVTSLFRNSYDQHIQT